MAIQSVGHEFDSPCGSFFVLTKSFYVHVAITEKMRDIFQEGHSCSEVWALG